jgi:CheY-like chemotaxis protein
MADLLILWVDDDIDDLELFQQAVAEVGPQTRMIRAYNGLEALQALEEASNKARLPDLIVLDMNMPRFGGRETLVSIKSHEVYKSIRTIVFTTSSNPLDKTFCDRYGVALFTKPQTYTLLTDLVRKFVGMCGR